MTTRAGLIGMISGIIISFIVHLVVFTWTDAIIHNSIFFEPNPIVERSIAFMLLLTGYFAARWNHSIERWRSIGLGGFSGIVSVIFLYSLWGAAFTVMQLSTILNIPITVMLQFTIAGFFKLFLIGGFFGAVGGYFFHPTRTKEKDTFNKEEPQMAMNASITAVSASIVAAAIAANTFPNLSAYIGMGSASLTPYVFPLYAALVLVVGSQFALTLVVPHESEQAEHVSGMDEVKMAAFVGIATGPSLIFILLASNRQLFGDLFIMVLIVCSVLLSLYSIRSLVQQVLPKRNFYPKHPTKEQGTQAALFGSIANSRAWRLITLCIGCGMAMVFPIYITVLAPLININAISNNVGPIDFYSEKMQQLFWVHIKTSMGLNLIVIVVLSAMYVFYLNLGRWFSKRHTGK